MQALCPSRCSPTTNEFWWSIGDSVAALVLAAAPAQACRSSPNRLSVEHRRFELLTSSMPWKRATNCANAPLLPLKAPPMLAVVLPGSQTGPRCTERPTARGGVVTCARAPADAQDRVRGRCRGGRPDPVRFGDPGGTSTQTDYSNLCLTILKFRQKWI